MSESLRARLKRSSRYFVSPATPKRPCMPHSSLATTPIAMGIVDEEQLKAALFLSPLKQGHVLTSDCVTRDLPRKESVMQYDKNYSEHETCSDMNTVRVTLKEEWELEDLKLIKSKLVQSIAEKEEVLRKLNLVKLQHEKVSYILNYISIVSHLCCC